MRPDLGGRDAIVMARTTADKTAHCWLRYWTSCTPFRRPSPTTVYAPYPRVVLVFTRTNPSAKTPAAGTRSCVSVSSSATPLFMRISHRSCHHARSVRSAAIRNRKRAPPLSPQLRLRTSSSMKLTVCLKVLWPLKQKLF